MGLKSKARRAFRRSSLYNAIRTRNMRRLADHHVGDLTFIRRQGAIEPGAMVLVAVMRDEALRLPDFLRHYRELGVERFGLIDNGSIDDTVSIAAAQPDVDLFHAARSFAAARSGMCWVNALIHRYRAMGAHPWIVFADIDEHLVYDGCEDHDLHDLAVHLASIGQPSLPTFLLDMYDKRPVSETHYAQQTRLLDAAPLFDGEYDIDDSSNLEAGNKRYCIQYFGGPRHRLFRERYDIGIKDSPRLAKVPFARWTDETLYLNSHEIYPKDWNFAPARGCLLHFKFLSDFHERVLRAVENKQHWRGSAEYQAYLACLNRNPNMTLAYEGSRRYRDSGSLLGAGLITDIDWQEGHDGYADAAE